MDEAAHIGVNVFKHDRSCKKMIGSLQEREVSVVLERSEASTRRRQKKVKVWIQTLLSKRWNQLSGLGAAT